jgi:hypothetical protein
LQVELREISALDIAASEQLGQGIALQLALAVFLDRGRSLSA